MSDIAKSIVFVACMYFGFEYDSLWAFVMAVLMFLYLVDEL